MQPGPAQVRAVTEDNSAIADLRRRWHTLCDADRALEVQSMHRAGMSLGKLAGHLNCSRSLLSRLHRAAKASPEDLDRARRGEISTRELARRTDATGSRGISRHREGITFEIERAAVRGSRKIESWLSDAGGADTDRKQIIEQARGYLFKTGRAARDQQENILVSMLFDEAERQHLLGRTVTERQGSISWTALSLALWVLRGIPDHRIRARALELASR